MKLIDLSVTINEDMPIFPGDPKTEIKLAGDLQKDGFEGHYLSINTHAGTHIDAPAHMLTSGKTLDQFPLEKFMGRGMVIKIVNNNFDLSVIKRVNINKGDIVLFHTGMSDVFTSQNISVTIQQFLKKLQGI